MNNKRTFILGLFLIVALVGITLGYVGYMLGYQEGYIDGLEYDKDENNPCPEPDSEPKPKPENKTWHGRGKKNGWCKHGG